AGNSPNHNRAGQNVLFADNSVRWHETPYVGYGYTAATGDKPPTLGDNIYSAMSIEPLLATYPGPFTTPGYIGRSIAPAHVNDSYLVPTAQDE
ncbi:MAG: hypothetical protein AAF743_17310, partial [Planctomycetota bacterium]